MTSSVPTTAAPWSLVVLLITTTLLHTTSGWVWCYSCQGVGAKTDCLETPARVVHGPGRLNCSHDLCVTQRDEVKGAVFAFYRGCVYRPELVSTMGSACTVSHEGDMRNCVTYCNSTLCNDGTGLPEDVKETYYTRPRSPRCRNPPCRRPHGRRANKEKKEDDDSIGGFFKRLFRKSSAADCRPHHPLAYLVLATTAATLLLTCS